MGVAVDVKDDAHLASLLEQAGGGVVVYNFHATWARQCEDMNAVFDELSKKHPTMRFLKIEAEEFPDVAESHEVASVPTFVVLRGNQPVDRVEGANAPALTSMIEKAAKMATMTLPITAQKQQSSSSTAATTTAKPGASAAPAADHYTTTTHPLTPEQLQTKLKTLVASNPVMIFIKGTPTAPRCGFSRQLIEALTDLNVQYGSFNILVDEDVRAGLKTFANWPTFPQVYINGEFVGGLDIVKELIASGELQKMLPEEEDLGTRLRRLVSRSPVMLFMKGDPEAPRCGFSRQIVKLLQDQKIKFDTFDILEDEEVRQGLKDEFNWPTFPQLYMSGELIGGLDIVKELIEANELKDMIPDGAHA